MQQWERSNHTSDSSDCSHSAEVLTLFIPNMRNATRGMRGRELGAGSIKCTCMGTHLRLEIYQSMWDTELGGEGVDKAYGKGGGVQCWRFEQERSVCPAEPSEAF